MTMRQDWDATPDDPFDDPVFFCPITSPAITPQGTTYEQSYIQTWLKQRKSDPFTRDRLFTLDLRKNHLFNTLKALFQADELDKQALQAAFTCPLSKQPFQDPVVASDGKTYERLYLEAYLSHQRTLPGSGIKQTGDFYPNRIVTALLQQHQNWLFPQGINKITPLIDNIKAYLTFRAAEPTYANAFFFFGKSKWEKFEACANLICALSGKISAPTFFNNPKNTDVLLEGRAEIYATPAILYLRENSLPRKPTT